MYDDDCVHFLHTHIKKQFCYLLVKCLKSYAFLLSLSNNKCYLYGEGTINRVYMYGDDYVQFLHTNKKKWFCYLSIKCLKSYAFLLSLSNNKCYSSIIKYLHHVTNIMPYCQTVLWQ